MKTKLMKPTELLIPSYQRKPRSGLVKSIVSNFMPECFQVMTVSHRKDDGLHYVMDGVVRREVAIKKGIDCKCEIHETLNEAEEAAIFRNLNMKRTALSRRDNFRAALCQGDQKMVRIREIVKSNGFNLDLGNGDAKAPLIKAIGILESVFDRFGEESLDAALTIIMRSWKGRESSLRGEVIGGLGFLWGKAFLYLNQRGGFDRLVAVLSEYEPTAIIAAARQMLPLVTGSGRDRAFAYAALTIYNKGLRNKVPMTVFDGEAL